MQSLPAPVTAPVVHVREAVPEDLDTLVAIEERVFATDRMSRRSFRRFLLSPTDALVVAERDGRVVGYALILFRAGTALARLYSIAVLPEAGRSGVGDSLLAASEEAALARGSVYLRLEVREDNARAIRLYRKRGYRLFGRLEDYYEDHADALRFERRLVPHVQRPLNAPPYFQQTADFTCGPTCMMMALAWADPGLKPEQSLEFKLWRESTTIFMTSGPGGCEPYGLAVTLKHHGLSPEIFVSHEGPFFLDGVRSEDKRRVMRLTQEAFRREAGELDIPVHLTALSESALMQAFDEGAIAIVLLSFYRMFGQKAPHWVLAHGHDGRHVFVHDPWIEHTDYETQTAAQSLPIPSAEFLRMTRYGREKLRAAVLIRKGPPQ